MRRSDSPMAGRLYSCREAAKHLDVSDDTVRRMIHSGRLQAVRLGKRILRVLGHSLEGCSTLHRLVVSGQAICTITPPPATHSREGGVA